MQDSSIRMRQLKQENHVAPKEHVRRLDVGPVDRSTYRQKTSGRGLGHRAKKSGYCAKDIGVAESTGRLGNSCRKGRCAEESDEASRDQRHAGQLG